MIKVTLKDNIVKEFDNETTVASIAAGISAGLLRNACAALVDGELKDLRHNITKDCNVKILTFDDEGGRHAFWHTTSHILAQAIKRLYPDAKLAIGPAISEGFYYDIETKKPLVPEDLAAIEDEMKKIVKEELDIEYFELERSEAIKITEDMDEAYKTELICDLPEDAAISFYKQGEFTDLCAEPHLMNTKGGLWERSGHWDHYKENIYTTGIEEQEFAIKPMNCPGGMLIFGLETRSYRDLPIRFGELGIVHRHEKSGALHGLMRVRCFTQDDAHIFMTSEQIKDEIIGVITLIDEVYSLLGFKYAVELSTRPESSMGSDEDWEHATNSLKEALDEKGLEYKINEGDGAFY
ncbi:threonine-trna ligase [Holotrichia oblita]|nr:threonine-trna ligase [Holotrichia oblita]